jgi:acetyl esterase/lipase
VEDCYAALVWMVENAEELGFDPNRLALYGGSAGGGWSSHRDAGPRPRRTARPLHDADLPHDRRHEHHGVQPRDRRRRIWDRDGNIEAWPGTSATASPTSTPPPTRAEDLTGLPPAFIDVGTVDLFRDEDIAFAQRLMQAGIPTELHVHDGAYHAAERFAPEAALSLRIWAARLDALRRALA